MEGGKSLVHYSPIGRSTTEGLGSSDQRPYWIGKTKATTFNENTVQFPDEHIVRRFFVSSNNMASMTSYENDLQSRSE